MSMDHQEAQENFSDYWEQSLDREAPEAPRSIDQGKRKEVEEHLRSCPSCQTEYEQFQKAMIPLGKLHKVPAPDMIGSVPALIHKRSAGRFFGPKGWLRRFPFEWVSLAMLALVGAIYAFVKLAR